MDDKDLVKLEQPEEDLADSQKEQANQQGAAKKASLAIFILVILLFAGVMFITYFFELKFGKTAGTVALIVAAGLIAAYLYRNELIEKIKRKK